MRNKIVRIVKGKCRRSLSRAELVDNVPVQVGAVAMRFPERNKYAKNTTKSIYLESFFMSGSVS
ncbi:MAG: hypothetical protein IJX22_06530 [Opitutales bacterium]|nr:hypothetical protein [Opitutales bacterium]